MGQLQFLLAPAIFWNHNLLKQSCIFINCVLASCYIWFFITDTEIFINIYKYTYTFCWPCMSLEDFKLCLTHCVKWFWLYTQLISKVMYCFRTFAIEMCCKVDQSAASNCHLQLCHWCTKCTNLQQCEIMHSNQITIPISDTVLCAWLAASFSY